MHYTGLNRKMNTILTGTNIKDPSEQTHIFQNDAIRHN